MNWQILPRIGYGASFNTLSICDSVLKKEAKNQYGLKKLQKEIAWYRFVSKNPSLPCPQILETGDSWYTMTYYPYPTLSSVFSRFSAQEKKSCLSKLFTELSNLHSSSSLTVSKALYIHNLHLETHSKILERYKQIEHILQEYSFLDTVNDVKLKSFEEILSLLQMKCSDYAESLSDYIYTPIHGDCQFNNILWNPEINSPLFIDPRGSFGSSDIYGPPEYDTAKIYFALSGYDTFDSMVIDTLTIDKHTLYLPNLMLLPHCLNKNDIITTFVISIWLANAHCFIDSPKKAVFSFFYARYLASLYL